MKKIAGVNFITLLTELIFDISLLGEGMSKTTLLYELKDFIEYSERGWNDELFSRKNLFELERRKILKQIPSEVEELKEIVNNDSVYSGQN